jgi:hypothetical protein
MTEIDKIVFDLSMTAERGKIIETLELIQKLVVNSEVKQYFKLVITVEAINEKLT